MSNDLTHGNFIDELTAAYLSIDDDDVKKQIAVVSFCIVEIASKLAQYPTDANMRELNGEWSRGKAILRKLHFPKETKI